MREAIHESGAVSELGVSDWGTDGTWISGLDLSALSAATSDRPSLLSSSICLHTSSFPTFTLTSFAFPLYSLSRFFLKISFIEVYNACAINGIHLKGATWWLLIVVIPWSHNHIQNIDVYYPPPKKVLSPLWSQSCLLPRPPPPCFPSL